MSAVLHPVGLDAELSAARERYIANRPKTRAAHDAACEVMPGGNTRTVLYHGPFPLRIAKGEGAWLTDVDGYRYVNLLGEYTAGLFGHSHPVIRKAINEALDGGVNLSAHNTYEARLASEVVKRFPAIAKVRFNNSGTEGNLMAVATARYFTKRSKVLVFKGGYHGGLLYFGGGGLPINAPYDFVLSGFNDEEGTRAVIRANAAELACVLVEPMLGSGGCVPGDPNFLQMLRDETRRAGALLIFDEVMTSRFGAAGAQGLYGINPDLVTLGKWIGGGMTFGAFGGRADIMAIYDPTKPGVIPHAGTFNNNVLTMSAGVAAMTQVFTPEVGVALHARGERFRARINSLFEQHEVPLQMTGMGSLMSLHATRGVIRNADDLNVSDDRKKELIFLDLLERGFYIARRGFIALSLAVTENDLERFLTELDGILTHRAEQLQSLAPNAN